MPGACLCFCYSPDFIPETSGSSIAQGVPSPFSWIYHYYCKFKVIYMKLVQCMFASEERKMYIFERQCLCILFPKCSEINVRFLVCLLPGCGDFTFSCKILNVKVHANPICKENTRHFQSARELRALCEHFANILNSAHFAKGTLKPGLQSVNPSYWQPSLAKSNRSKVQHSTTCRQRHGLKCDATTMGDLAKKSEENFPQDRKRHKGFWACSVLVLILNYISHCIAV